MQTTHKTNEAPKIKATITLTEKDVSELYFVIRSRGESGFRRKMERALRKISPRWHSMALDK